MEGGLFVQRLCFDRRRRTPSELDMLRRTTQVVWFEKHMNLRGFDFMKDDIAFGYSGFSGGSIDATLFRPTTNGSSYTASTGQLTAVPEPSSLFMAVSWIALAFMKWRRQIFTRFAIGQFR